MDGQSFYLVALEDNAFENITQKVKNLNLVSDQLVSQKIIYGQQILELKKILDDRS